MAQGFAITRSALRRSARRDRRISPTAAFSGLAKEAERNCPVSKILKAEITLDAKLT